MNVNDEVELQEASAMDHNDEEVNTYFNWLRVIFISLFIYSLYNNLTQKKV